MISLLVLVALALTICVGFWSGLLSSYNKVEASPEDLEFVNVSSSNLSGAEALSISVRNSGLKDVQIEYIVLNGNVTPYATKTSLGTVINYDSVTKQFLIIPYNSQVEIFLPYSLEQNSTAEIKLHTVAGNDFVARTAIIVTTTIQ